MRSHSRGVGCTGARPFLSPFTWNEGLEFDDYMKYYILISERRLVSGIQVIDKCLIIREQTDFYELHARFYVEKSKISSRDKED